MMLGVAVAACGNPPPRDPASATADAATSSSQGAAAMPGMGGTHAGASVDPAQMDAAMVAQMKSFPLATEGVGGRPLQPTILADGTKQFALVAAVTQWQVGAGKTVAAWTYNGTFPGPTIRVEVGDRVQVVLTNNLPESTAIHVHGVAGIPNNMDGVPGITQDPVKPGTTFTYAFMPTAPAVGMYHSHYDTLKQLDAGLMGALLVGDEPLPAGVVVTQSTNLVLQDSGPMGFSFNGKSFPATAPVVAHTGDWVLVNYYNVGEMSHPIHLHGPGQLLIAKDGYPVAQPQMQDTINVSPGERYTVLIHATAPGAWVWHCHILGHTENDAGMFGMVTALVVQ